MIPQTKPSKLVATINFWADLLIHQTFPLAAIQYSYNIDQASIHLNCVIMD